LKVFNPSLIDHDVIAGPRPDHPAIRDRKRRRERFRLARDRH
jgi:hypothetical protein